MSNRARGFKTRHLLLSVLPMAGRTPASVAAPENVLPEHNAFCMAPWVHLHVTHQGNVTPCCRISAPIANVNRQSLEEIWNGEALRALRRQFLKGQGDPRCWRCYAHEQAGGKSLRTFFNQRFLHHADWVQATDSDGSVHEARPVFWDLRFSNICNFRCRTCWHGSSSRWHGDAIKLGQQVGDSAVIQNIKDSGTFLAALRKFAPDLEEITFAGGEPLIMDEHYKILKDLTSRGLRGVKLRYNTNLSELRYKGIDLLNLWREFDQVEVRASLDGIGIRGEMIRKDLSWPRFAANVRRIRDEAPHIDFGIDVTVSVLNLFHLPEMQRALFEDGLVAIDRLELRPLHDPPYYNIKMLPADYKGKARALFAEQAHWLREFGTQRTISEDRISDAQAALRFIITFMDLEDFSHHLPQFSTVTRELDIVRGEPCAEICPELRPLIEQPYRQAGFLKIKLVEEQSKRAARRILNRGRHVGWQI